MAGVIITEDLLDGLKHLKITTESGSVYEIKKEGRGEGKHYVYKNGELIKDMGCYAIHPAFMSLNGKAYQLTKSERLGFCCTKPDMTPYSVVTSPIVKFEMLECFSGPSFTIETKE